MHGATPAPSGTPGLHTQDGLVIMIRYPLASLALLAATMTPAFSQSGTSTSASGPCADTEFKPGYKDFKGPDVECSCSDGSVSAGFGASVPGAAGLGGSYTGGTGATYCASYTVYPPIWERIDGEGNSIVVPDDEKAKVFEFTAGCDLDGCHQFLGFLWTYGHASCSYTSTMTAEITTYIETGQSCTPSNLPTSTSAPR